MNESFLVLCPDKYGIDKDKKKCILKIYNNIEIDEFKINILNGIISFVNLSQIIINGSDFLAVILSSDDIDSEEQINKGISAIDLGECIKIVKQNSNDGKRVTGDNLFNLGKKTELEIFDSSRNKLNLSVCNHSIKVMKYIGDIDNKKLVIQSAKNLANKGVDLFNPKDDFFHNICKKLMILMIKI